MHLPCTFLHGYPSSALLWLCNMSQWISNGSLGALVLTVVGTATTFLGAVVVVHQQVWDDRNRSRRRCCCCCTHGEPTAANRLGAVKDAKYSTGRYQSSKQCSGPTMATTTLQSRAAAAAALPVCGCKVQPSVSFVHFATTTSCSSSSQECETMALEQQHPPPPPLLHHVDSWTRAAHWAWWSYAQQWQQQPSDLGTELEPPRHHTPSESSTTTDTTTTTLHSADSTTLQVPWTIGPCRLLYAQETSAPWLPAHFLLHLHEDDQNHNDDDALHVLLVIRGTSSWAELLWTALLGSCGSYLEESPSCQVDPTEPFVYHGTIHGRVHAYFMECGRALVQLHHERLAQYCRALGKTHVRITCVGHSLGGAVAVMTGLTWNQMPDDALRHDNDSSSNGAALPHICVDRVIALGCPPCASLNLAEACADFVTTLICRDDVVPRWSITAVADLVPQLLQAAILSVDNDPLSLLLAALAWGTSMEHVDPNSPSLPASAPSAPDRLCLLLQWMNQQSKVLLDHPQPPQETEAVLLPPGRCIQLETRGRPDGSTTVSALRVPNSYYAQIRPSPSMLSGT
jgi:Lipase (class 3)